MDLDEDTLRACRHKVDKNAEILNRMSDQIVAKYSAQLDKIVNDFKTKLSQLEKMDNDEIEKLALMIPATLYFTVAGLETLGMDTDSAKASRMEAYNTSFLEAQGTIPDKEHEAEVMAVREQLVEAIFSRAYKKLKSKTEVAMQLSMSARKVLEKRIQEINVDRMDGAIKEHR